MARTRIVKRLVIACACVVTTIGSTAAGGSAAPNARPKRREVAGYLKAAEALDGVGAVFTVPTVTCPEPDAAFQGTAEGVVIYTTTGGFSDAAVVIGCTGSSPTYTGEITIDGVETKYAKPVAPGDTVRVAIGTHPGEVAAIVQDRTHQWHKSFESAARTATEMGVGAIALGCTTDGCSPAAEVTPVKFRRVGFNSGELVDATVSRFRANDGSLELGASKLGPAQRGFTVRWWSTCDPGSGAVC